MSLVECLQLVVPLQHLLELRSADLDVGDEVVELDLVLDHGDLPGGAFPRRIVVDELLRHGVLLGLCRLLHLLSLLWFRVLLVGILTLLALGGHGDGLAVLLSLFPEEPSWERPSSL